jgi:hypothetical protein
MSLRSKTFSLSLCAILLVLGTSITWQNYHTIVHAKTRHAKLVTAARFAGISSDEDAMSASLRSSKRARTSTQVDLKLLLNDLQLVLKNRHRDLIPEEMVQLENCLDRCGRLSPQQMEAFLASIRAFPDLSDQERFNMVQMTFLAFSETQPAHTINLASLDPYASIPGIFNAITTNAIAAWAKDDLPGAVEWAKANPDKLYDGIRLKLIEQTAEQNLAHGLRLVSEIQLDNPSYGYSVLLTESKPEDSPVILTSLRQYLAQLPDEASRESASKKLFSDVADDLTRDGYETHRKWLESTQLTLPELEIFSTKVAETKSLKDPSQWIDWIGNKLGPEKSAVPIQTMVKNWTQTDYQAAGKWLTATPDGPNKNAAIRAYAETVAKADPEVAKQWALTLPPGPEREETLQRIQTK